MVAPRATYRLQLRGGLTLRDLRARVPYLAALGVSHAYLAPLLRARPESTHGYDVVDPTRLDPVLGDEADLEALVETLRAHGMGILLDVVPNHVGIGGSENPWWLDLLEYGPESAFAGFFDVDFAAPEPELRGRVLVPFLGEALEVLLARGGCDVAVDVASGSLFASCDGLRLPLAPATWDRVLGDAGAPRPAALEESLHAAREAAPGAVRARGEVAKAALARALADEGALRTALEARLDALGRPESHEELAGILAAQAYRLAPWQEAAPRLNYRRFFDVGDLAGLRAERPEVFEATHARILAWVRRDLLDGLRVDHVDGLLDPAGYLRRLVARCAPRRPWLLVEKILAPHERLPEEWPVDGTTGYEFLNLVNGLLVDPLGAAPLAGVRATVAGEPAPAFEPTLRQAKRDVLHTLLAADLARLRRELLALAESEGAPPEATPEVLGDALEEVLAGFRVYRTYVDERGASPEDRTEIDYACEAAREARPDLHPEPLGWLRRVLLGEAAGAPGRAFRGRFQQTSGPVTAKALEDTTFYRLHRFLSLCEVGGDPRRFGVGAAPFHAGNRERGGRWPRSLLATATHDTKLGEDTRARIDVLSEIPDEWAERVEAFRTQTAAFRTEHDGGEAPRPEHELRLYQAMLGSWPAAWCAADPDAEGLAAWRERLQGYAVKAVREGKEMSSWSEPDTGYEEALRGFLARALDARRGAGFLAELTPFARRVAGLGVTNGLTQLVLKLTSPGVPDLYQGTELWDLSLVDPDNRRPVDFDAREDVLRDLEEAWRAGGQERLAHGLVAHWPDGRLKLLVTWRVLQLRRERPALFAGAYEEVAPEGERAVHVLSFARSGPGGRLLVAATRLAARLPRRGPFPLGSDAFLDTRIPWRSEGEARPLVDVLTGRSVVPAAGGLRVAEIFALLPVAALVEGDVGGGG